MKIFVRSTIGALLNHPIIRPILVRFRLDYLASKVRNNWAGKRIDEKKSLQQNMGFSERPEIQLALDRIHSELQALYQQVCVHGPVLDVGCGVGLYLSDFPEGTDRSGIDVSGDFIRIAQERLPTAALRRGDYLATDFDKRFSLIFSVGVLQYIPPSRIPDLVVKLSRDLDAGGLVFIHYPHALSEADCQNPDLTYLLYSPEFLEKQFKSAFEIVSHSHAFDRRPLGFRFDNERYDEEMNRSVRNCAILVARKK